ncbi:MAG: endonuclease [Christensenellaceae bacterium]|jgi:endonuclease-3 related protein|nr:endonuclease [Christensenellaceae bacterium]
MDNLITSIYDLLYNRYGHLNWWPALSIDARLRAYEIMVGAILTQNTAWQNVEKALANFGNKLAPQFVEEIDVGELASIIRPAGFYNQKAIYIKSITEWFKKYDYDVSKVGQHSLGKLRAELLLTKGNGQETADSILLYAFNFPTFVVDAYTIRLCDRVPIMVGLNYNEVKKHFESKLEIDSRVYNNYHALIVENSKMHCRKKPICTNCPLQALCSKSGI